MNRIKTLLLACLLLAGCTSVKSTSAARSSQELLQISTAADRAADTLAAQVPSNLTAYLDGELDEDGTRQIETVLAGSTVARNDVELLAKTYELLDLLPRPKASGEFTEKTMQTAKLKEVRTDPRQTVWYRHGKRIVRWASWAALLFVAACVGYSIARFQVPRD